MEELLPFLQKKYKVSKFKSQSFAGFSLGGLTAIDIVWSHPEEFTYAGVFSGSLWWRSVDQTEKEYDDHKHRIIHQRIREGVHHAGLKFFFQCGNKDESRDRNQNGIIDSIDDTLDLVNELRLKGYRIGEDIAYLELEDGHHNIATWARAMPVFLRWAFAS
jgi:enterochelin esterase-like enzyme